MRDPNNPVARRARQLAADGDDRMVAAVDLIGRTGAAEFQIRYCEEEQPVIWMAAASWKGHWEAGAGMSPLAAVFRLLDQVVDGGTCQHCQRPTGFEPSADPMPMDKLVCWYQYDPGTRKFTKGCTQ
jgi:hypothetical protein